MNLAPAFMALALIEISMGIVLGVILHSLLHKCKDSPDLEAWKRTQIERLNSKADYSYYMKSQDIVGDPDRTYRMHD